MHKNIIDFFKLNQGNKVRLSNLKVSDSERKKKVLAEKVTIGTRFFYVSKIDRFVLDLVLDS